MLMAYTLICEGLYKSFSPYTLIIGKDGFIKRIFEGQERQMNNMRNIKQQLRRR